MGVHGWVLVDLHQPSKDTHPHACYRAALHMRSCWLRSGMAPHIIAHAVGTDPGCCWPHAW